MMEHLITIAESLHKSTLYMVCCSSCITFCLKICLTWITLDLLHASASALRMKNCRCKCRCRATGFALTPLIYHIHQDTRFQPGHLRVLNIIVPMPTYLPTYSATYLPLIIQDTSLEFLSDTGSPATKEGRRRRKSIVTRNNHLLLAICPPPSPNP